MILKRSNCPVFNYFSFLSVGCYVAKIKGPLGPFYNYSFIIHLPSVGEEHPLEG